MKYFEVVFIVIAYNQFDLVDRCLEKLTTFLPSSCTVVLFDNHSHETLEPLSIKYGVSFLRSEQNLGFAAGCNVAIEFVLKNYSAQQIALVNSDLFIDKAFGKALPQVLKETLGLAAWQPALYFDEEHTRLENRGILYFSSGRAVQNRGKEKTSVLLNGACLFLSVSTVYELIETDGFVFIPDFFFNAEDLELSLRLYSRKKQVKIIDTLSAQHLGQQSSASEISLMYYVRNLWWTIIITWDRPLLKKNLLYVCLGQFQLFVYCCIRFRMMAYFKAFQQTWSSRKRLRALRVHMQQHAQRSIEPMFQE